MVSPSLIRALTLTPRPGKEGCLVAEEEWQRFAESEGSRFPLCQYTSGAAAHDGECGVALVGDALHAFPPDIGQGVHGMGTKALAQEARGAGSFKFEDLHSIWEKECVDMSEWCKDSPLRVPAMPLRGEGRGGAVLRLQIPARTHCRAETR